MKEEDHQIELKEGYEQDEEYEKSEDQILKILHPFQESQLNKNYF